MDEKEFQERLDRIRKVESETNENSYLIMGFMQFGIISTLVVAFFPWSLLFCLVVYGMDDTKFLVLALLHDALKTILAILAVVVPLAVGLFLLVMVLAQP